MLVSGYGGLQVVGRVHYGGGEHVYLGFRGAVVVFAVLVFVDDVAGIDGHLVSASGYMRGLQDRDAMPLHGPRTARLAVCLGGVFAGVVVRKCLKKPQNCSAWRRRSQAQGT